LINQPEGLDTRKVLADSTLVVLATVSGGAVLFLVNLLLAKQFGPEEFGQFRVVIGLFSFIVVLVELGTGPSLIKYVSELGVERTRELVRKVLLLRAAGYLGLAAVAIIARNPLAALVLKDPNQGAYILAGAIFLLFLYFEICKFIVLAHQRIKLFAGSIALTYLSIGVLSVVGAFSGGVFGAVVGWGFGYLLGNAPCISYISRTGALRPGPRMEVKRIIFSYGFPMQLEQMIRSLELAVVPFFSLFYGRAEIGALAFSMVFYRTARTASSALNSVLLPRFARMAHQPELAKQSMRKLLTLFTPICLVGAVAAVLVAEPLVLIIDRAYLPAVPVLRMLLVYGLVSTYAAILVSYFAGLGRVRQAVYMSSIQQAGLIVASFTGLATLIP